MQWSGCDDVALVRQWPGGATGDSEGVSVAAAAFDRQVSSQFGEVAGEAARGMALAESVLAVDEMTDGADGGVHVSDVEEANDVSDREPS